MRIPRFARTIILMLAALSTLSAADSIQLRNGRHLQGKYIGGTTTMVGFMTSGGIEYFATADVLALMFDNNEAPLNGLQPNHMNGDSSWPGPGTTQNMSHQQRKPAASPKRVDYRTLID